MTPDELQKLYESLEAEEKQLRDQLNKIANKNPAVKGDYQIRVPNYGDEDDENTQEVVDLDRNLALEREFEDKLREIEKTKEKIKNGTYGKCENCSVEINESRLKVRPASTLCVKCAESAQLA